MKLDVMLALEEEEGRISLSRVEEKLGMSKTTIWRILVGEGFHPYKIHYTQELKPSDHGARVQFAERQLDFAAADQNYASKILWTDESIFSVHGGVNKQNDR